MPETSTKSRSWALLAALAVLVLLTVFVVFRRKAVAAGPSLPMLPPPAKKNGAAVGAAKSTSNVNKVINAGTNAAVAACVASGTPAAVCKAGGNVVGGAARGGVKVAKGTAKAAKGIGKAIVRIF